MKTNKMVRMSTKLSSQHLDIVLRATEETRFISDLYDVPNFYNELLEYCEIAMNDNCKCDAWAFEVYDMVTRISRLATKVIAYDTNNDLAEEILVIVHPKYTYDANKDIIKLS